MFVKLAETTDFSKLRGISKGNSRRSPSRRVRTPIKSQHRSIQSEGGPQSAITVITSRLNNWKSLAPRTPKKPVTPKLSMSLRQKRPTSTRQRKPVQVRKFSMDLVAAPIYASKTRKGYIPDQPGKVNQDSYFTVPDIKGFSFYGVCDGHGQFGREVSSYVKSRLPQLLANHSLLRKDPAKALYESIIQVGVEVPGLNVDSMLSGTTLVAVLMDGLHLYCANVGDSRAVLGRLNEDQWTQVPLSEDHKPDSPGEKERILKAGGRVQAYIDEEGNPQGPARVWLAEQNLPGLAMSRSLGDLVAARVGVIYEPEIIQLEIKAEDKFLVIGSDGIFEFLNNEQVIKIAAPYWKHTKPQLMAEVLVRQARDLWVREEEVVDDITAVCVFINNS